MSEEPAECQLGDSVKGVGLTITGQVSPDGQLSGVWYLRSSNVPNRQATPQEFEVVGAGWASGKRVRDDWPRCWVAGRLGNGGRGPQERTGRPLSLPRRLPDSDREGVEFFRLSEARPLRDSIWITGTRRTGPSPIGSCPRRFLPDGGSCPLRRRGDPRFSGSYQLWF